MAIGISTNVMTPAVQFDHRTRRASNEKQKSAPSMSDETVREQTAKVEKTPIKVTIPPVTEPAPPSATGKLAQSRVPVEKHPILLPTPTEVVATPSQTGSLVNLRA